MKDKENVKHYHLVLPITTEPGNIFLKGMTKTILELRQMSKKRAKNLKNRQKIAIKLGKTCQKIRENTGRYINKELVLRYTMMLLIYRRCL